VTGRRYPIDAVGVLWLDDLSLRSLHNPATVDAVLLAVARRADPGSAAPDSGG